jgi:shikimate dehydrogenase
MTRLAVLGSPILHSLSPTIHRAAYELLDLDWQYDAIEVREGGLRDFLDSCDSNWRGLSLTMPLKAEAITVCARVDPLAIQVGGANTITWKGSISQAHNTDVLGCRRALDLADASGIDSVTILGGGATARAAVAAASSFAKEITVYLRNIKRNEGLRKALGESKVELHIEPWNQATNGLSAPLVISTTPKGATDALAGLVPVGPGFLFEVLYDPWPTKLVSAWEGAGGQVLGGLELLVEQAMGQIRLFAPEVEIPDASSLRDVMLSAGRAELIRRNSSS